jgi:subtilisin family serine protease
MLAARSRDPFRCAARTIADLRGGSLLLAAAAAFLALAGPGQASGGSPTEVVVTLAPPPLAEAVAKSRVLTLRTRHQRLDLRSPTSVSYLEQLAAGQRTLKRRILAAIPSARIRWHFSVVLDGFAVVVPREDLQALSRVPGVAAVLPGTTMRATLDRSPELIGADQLWGLPSFSTAGNGIKIGIIDDGVDQAHPFFDPTGYAYPSGFPKGNKAYTTPKVIVARAFAPPTTTWKYAHLPFDPLYSFHGTHVGGIAAGDYTVGAVSGRGPLSGVAPKAYLGNYKMDSTPFAGGELIENSVEMAAAIEAAVRDGMDVINISFGETEVPGGGNIIDKAVDAAADAGVVPAIAAGNDGDEFGRGSISSPATAQKGIAVAAVTKSDVIAAFSSIGPTALSLRPKPDVSAPGVSILSSVPPRQGTWTQFDGTSMATPHVAGAAALLKQRHPDWTVAQVKSALVLTALPAYVNPAHTVEATTSREGGGLINLPRANKPLVFASPSDLSFGLVRVGSAASRTVSLTDAGFGAGSWDVKVAPQEAVEGVAVTAPPAVNVPGTLTIRASASRSAAEADVTGFVVLSQSGETRRIPYWFRVERPRLERPSATLSRPGVYHGDTKGKPARVRSYRYPDDPSSFGVATTLSGPEEVFRIRIRKRVANFGIRLLSEGPTVAVTPRLVAAGDENRLLGYRALPLTANPYLYPDEYKPEPVVGAVRTPPGTYDVVFDSMNAADAGRFKFEFWVNDTSPPRVRLLTTRVKTGGELRLSAADGGSGVEPESIRGTIDAGHVTPSFAHGRISIRLSPSLARGRHRLLLQVSDYQEDKNSETVPGVLPNTRFYRATFSVTR